ncbi:MAG: 3-dehydroquinate synthase, partial [Thaumarchaeota archaeon]|nr:3-dehydroquinate synthase [Nitrososphaerota archaeon]
MAKSRELIISPKVSRGQLAKFLTEIEKEGIKIVNVDPSSLKGLKTKLATIHASQNADYVIVDKAANTRGKKVGMKFKVLSNTDIEKILQFAKQGLDFVVVEVKDWKIIPLENIIAKLHKIHTKIFAIANSPEEVRKMFSILEIGVDGVIFLTSSLNEVREALVYLGTKSFDLKPAKILEIKEVGNGERVCVDT